MKRMSLRARRRGAILPLTTIMLIFIVALLALAVDLGWIINARTQMQTAADAAALAGASQLLDPSNLQGTPNTGTASNTAMIAANSEAIKFAQKNSAGGVSLTLADNSTNNSSSGDIVCGYLANPSNHSQALTPTVPGVGPYPNSVQVKVHRDSVRNGSLALFFAPALGITSFDLQAQATATYEGGITGFQIRYPGVSTCKLLPLALNVNTWNSVLAGSGPDTFSRNNSTGAISAGPDNIHECKLFPLSNGGISGSSGLTPGNFGTINIGNSSNGTSTTNRLILNGPNATDLSVYPGGKLQLDPTTGTLLMSGNTGVSAGMTSALQSIVGQSRIVSLYSSVSGTGANAQYTIVGFAGVTICEAVLTGSLSSKHLTIQPCWTIDPNSLGGGTNSTSSFIVKPLALTR